MYNNTFFWKMFTAKIAFIESALTDSYHQGHQELSRAISH